MAFGLFKKDISADTIFMNGHIFTQDDMLPWASAVACKDGKILTVGDYDAMDTIINDDTEIIDLMGKYVFPGFIDAHCTPVLKALEDLYLIIEPEWNTDSVLEMLSDYIDDNENADVYFGYGFSEGIIDGYDADKAHELLDAIESEKPVILLGENGVHCWLNSCAADAVAAAADEDDTDYITLPHILNLFLTFDDEKVEENIFQISDDFADRGITSYFNVLSPEYFNDIYLDTLMEMYNQDASRQKYYGSLLVNRPFNTDSVVHSLIDRKTACMEMSGLINCDFLKIVLSCTNNRYFTQEQLNALCLAVSENGFNIHIDALDRDALIMSYEAFDFIRTKGCRKNTLVIASDDKLSTQEEAQYVHACTFITTWASNLLNASVFPECKTSDEAINQLTIDAARILGKENELGSIERGKYADFTIFDKNPLSESAATFRKMHATMTVINGQTVYDADEEALEEIYDLLSVHPL